MEATDFVMLDLDSIGELSGFARRRPRFFPLLPFGLLRSAASRGLIAMLRRH
jgi:hypothetical protein